MSVFSLQTSSSGTLASGGGLASFARRALKAWTDMRSERVLSSLPYDTLKDIGFPSAHDPRNTPTR